MATIRDLLAKIRQAKADLIANREADALRIALDQIALVKLRIQSRGENAAGAKFPPYVPPYAREREKKGYQIEFVDLTRTGRTLAAIVPVVVESSIFTATISIQGADDQTRAILGGLSRKRGNILEPSADELQLVRDANRQRIRKYFQF